jgi:hypothetical protein
VALGVGPEFKHQYHQKKKEFEDRINVAGWLVKDQIIKRLEDQ